MDDLFDEFQISCEMAHRYPGPRGFSWNVSSRKSERATKRRHRWQRVAERREREGLFSLSSQYRNGYLLFPGISASNTNFHFVNQLVRYEPIFIIDTNVQQLWIGSPAVFVEGRFSSRTQDDLYIPVSRFAPNYHHWHDGMYSISELLSPAIFVVRWSVRQEKRRRSVHSRETVRHHVSSWARRYVHHLHGKPRRSVE